MIEDRKRILEIGKEIAKEMLKHLKKCKEEYCDFCEMLPDIFDYRKVRKLKKSDYVEAFWMTVAHERDDCCSECAECKIYDMFSEKYPLAIPD